MKRTKWLGLLLVLSLFVLAGCQTNPAQDTENKQDPEPVPVTHEIVLYFADQQAEYLVAEKRSIQVTAIETQLLAEAIINELIAGPQDNTLSKTIPPEARLLSATIQDKVAILDFSTELQTKHWGGSAGETMTIMSVVNSLTELPGIEKVQFLINGQELETLVGHWDLSAPIARDPKMIP